MDRAKIQKRVLYRRTAKYALLFRQEEPRDVVCPRVSIFARDDDGQSVRDAVVKLGVSLPIDPLTHRRSSRMGKSTRRNSGAGVGREKKLLIRVLLHNARKRSTSSSTASAAG